MSAKSDFAGKLLHDLRVRKERMATTQNSRSQPSKADMQGDPWKTHRGARQTNRHDSSRMGNSTRGSGGGPKAISTAESSNQMVLYNGGNKSKQVKDLSMAIAFAFENGGKLGKISNSSSNPLVNFFHRFSRGLAESGKIGMTDFSKNSFSANQFHTVSHIHITEIAKGVQNLNQILRACSNGFEFDKNSIEVGRELLKGAIHLEESLRMLVNIQEASKYTKETQQKSRIRLLEEDDDDQDTSDKTENKKQLDRPKFSFDKPIRNSPSAQRATKNEAPRHHLLALSYLDEATKPPVRDSKMVPHKRSVSCIPYLDSHSTQAKQKINSNNTPQLAQEKGRISNVVAKLMGLEELPKKNSPTCTQKELSTKPKEGKEKDRKVSSKNPKLPAPFNGDCKNGAVLRTDKTSLLTNNSTQIMDTKFSLKAEKSRETPDGNSKLKNSVRNEPRKNLKMQTTGMDAVSFAKLGTTVVNKQENHTILPNQVAGLQTFVDKEQNQNISEKEERKISETGETNVLLLNKKPHQRAQQNSTFLKDENVTNENIEFKARLNHMEKRDAKKDLPSNQQNPQDKCAAFQIPGPKKPEISEDKHQEVQKGHSLFKQNLTARKQKGCQEEAITSSKTKQGPANIHKKQSSYRTTPMNGISIRFNEKVSLKDQPSNMYQNDVPNVENHNTAANQEVIEKEDQSCNLSSRDEAQASNSTSMGTQEKPIAVSASQKKANSKKLQTSKNPRKIELMTRCKGNVNELPRSSKESVNLLQDLKQHTQNKCCSTKKLVQQSGDQVKEGEVGIMMHGSLGMKMEPSNQSHKLPEEAEQMTALSCFEDEDCRKQSMQNKLTLDGTSDDLASKPKKAYNDFQKVEQINAVRDEQEIKEYDQSSCNLRESTGIKDFSQLANKQLSELGRREQLTEDEKDLKEMLIKSQMFLNAAEALFKLNMPFTFLHAGDPNDEVADRRLIMDCGYEVMNRKARRYQVTHHPSTNTTINYTTVRSLDDLVKRLSKDLEVLKFYGGNRGNETDVAVYLYNMLNKDIYNEDPDVNSTWDFEWNKMKYMFPEKEDVIKDVEKYMLNGLLDEISKDLLFITVSV